MLRHVSSGKGEIDRRADLEEAMGTKRINPSSSDRFDDGPERSEMFDDIEMGEKRYGLAGTSTNIRADGTLVSSTEYSRPRRIVVDRRSAINPVILHRSHAVYEDGKVHVARDEPEGDTARTAKRDSRANGMGRGEDERGADAGNRITGRASARGQVGQHFLFEEY